MTGHEIAVALDTAAGLPHPPAGLARRGGRRWSPSSWTEAFEAQTVEITGGHLHWTVATAGRGTPMAACGGQVETVYRLAFRWWHGREPDGRVRPTCDYPCCVAGAHLADRVLREGGVS